MKKIANLSLSVILLLFLAIAALAGAPASRWATYDSSKVHYLDAGKHNKKAIIFIHGWTCSAEFWRESYNAFPGYRVLAIDLPGHGQSDKPHADYTMEYFARSIEAVMKDAGVNQAVFAGHSMGTPVIRQFYRLYPKQTLGLIVVDGALQPFGPRVETEKFFIPLFTNYQEKAPEFIDGMLAPTRADLKAGIRSSMLATPDHVAISAMKGMLDDSIWTSDQISVPVLAIMAEKPWPADNGDIYKKVAPDLKYLKWTGVSHFLMMERPKEFNEAIKAFIVDKKLL